MDNNNDDNYKLFGRILDTLIYVYIIMMFIISVLLLINTILNIILFNYYNYNDKNIDYNNKKLYVHETLAYKIFISKIKDNLNNFNNYYFTLNVSSDLLKIFLVFTIVFFTLLMILDSFILILSYIEKNGDNSDSKNIYIAFIIFFIIIISIYYSILFCVNYYEIIISIIVIWFFTSLLMYYFTTNNNNNTLCNYNSIYYLINGFFVEKKKLLPFTITLMIIVFIIWILLLTCYGILDGTALYGRVNNRIDNNYIINYDHYSFNENNTDINNQIYNSLENFIHNKYLKKLDSEKIKLLKSRLEGYNIYTIEKFELIPSDSVEVEDGNDIKGCIDFIKYICSTNGLTNPIYKKDYNETRLDFIKLFNIFLDNEIIHNSKNSLGRDNNENDLHKDFNFLFNMNTGVPNQKTYNIENVLIGAFPLDYILFIKSSS